MQIAPLLGLLALSLGGFGHLRATSLGRPLLGGDPLIGALGAQLGLGSQLHCPLAFAGGLTAAASVLLEHLVAQRLPRESADLGLSSLDCQLGVDHCAATASSSQNAVDRQPCELEGTPDGHS